MVLLKKAYNYNWVYDSHYRLFCIHNCCQLLMQYYGVKNRELYLNCIWDCRVKFDDELIYGFAIANNNLPILEQYSIWYQIAFHDNYERTWSANCDVIDQGTPVIIALDRYYLPYAADYGNKHGAHAALLIGYDSINTAYIIDCHSDGIYKGPVSYDELCKARLSDNAWNGYINSGQALKSASLVLNPAIPDGSVKHVICSFSTLREQYFCNTQPGYGQKSLRNALNSILANTTDVNHEDFFQYLYGQLFPIMQKKVLFDYYLEYASIYGQDIFQQARQLLAAIIYEWKNSLQIILRLAYSMKQNKSRLHEELVKSLDIAFNHENEFAIYLEEKIYELHSKEGQPC